MNSYLIMNMTELNGSKEINLKDMYLNQLHLNLENSKIKSTNLKIGDWVVFDKAENIYRESDYARYIG